MNDIEFIKGNGGMGRQSANEDPISGLLMRLPGLTTTNLAANGFDVVAVGEKTLYIATLKYFEQLEALGIVESDMSSAVLKTKTLDEYKDMAAMNAIVYHVAEFFKKSDAGTLYLGIKVDAEEIVKAEVKQMQYYSGGKLRRLGIFTKSLTNIADYQTAVFGGEDVGLEEQHQPLSIFVTYCGQLDNATAISAETGTVTITSTVTPETISALKGVSNQVLAGRSNVSILVGCDLDVSLIEKLGIFAYYGAIGTMLGCSSFASVNESIAWVGKFPLGIKMPGFITGDLLGDVTAADIELINDNRYIFIRVHVGDANNYFNDSFTLDVATSDYAYIENVLTIDKAIRGIRANLLPYLNSPLRVDAETGKLAASIVSYLETVAGRALEDMEKVDELSGYSVEIDPDQNILSSSQLEIVIKQVGVGVMRKVRVKIGYVTSIK